MRMIIRAISCWHRFLPQFQHTADFVQQFYCQELVTIKSYPLTDVDVNLAASPAEYCLRTEHDLAISAIYSVYVNEPSINRITSRVCHDGFHNIHHSTYVIASESSMCFNANPDGLIHKFVDVPNDDYSLSGKSVFNSFQKPATEAESVKHKTNVSVSNIVNLELQHRFKPKKTPRNLGRSRDSHTASRLKGRGSKFVFSTLENLPVLDGCCIQAGTQRTFITCPPSIEP